MTKRLSGPVAILKWQRAMIAGRLVSPAEFLVGTVVASFVGNETAIAFPSFAKIAKSANTSERTAKRAVSTLVKLGYLVKVTGGGRRKSNEYSLALPDGDQPENGVAVDTVFRANGVTADTVSDCTNGVTADTRNGVRMCTKTVSPVAHELTKGTYSPKLTKASASASQQQPLDGRCTAAALKKMKADVLAVLGSSAPVKGDFGHFATIAAIIPPDCDRTFLLAAKAHADERIARGRQIKTWQLLAQVMLESWGGMLEHVIQPDDEADKLSEGGPFPPHVMRAFRTAHRLGFIWPEFLGPLKTREPREQLADRRRSA